MTEMLWAVELLVVGFVLLIKGAELAGGIILVLIGVKILLEHLGFVG